MNCNTRTRRALRRNQQPPDFTNVSSKVTSNYPDSILIEQLMAQRQCRRPKCQSRLEPCTHSAETRRILGRLLLVTHSCKAGSLVRMEPLQRRTTPLGGQVQKKYEGC